MFLPSKSPCLPCDKLHGEFYPGCTNYCYYLNAYLIDLGDLPRLLDETNIAEKFPPVKGDARFKFNLASKEDTAAACDKIIAIKNQTGWSTFMVAENLGLTHSYINNMSRRTMKRMNAEWQKMIMAFEIKAARCKKCGQFRGHTHQCRIKRCDLCGRFLAKAIQSTGRCVDCKEE
jgi:predicted metallopeptidase